MLFRVSTQNQYLHAYKLSFIFPCSTVMFISNPYSMNISIFSHKFTFRNFYNIQLNFSKRKKIYTKMMIITVQCKILNIL